jgi:hypothetical protein
MTENNKFTMHLTQIKGWNAYWPKMREFRRQV